MCCARRRRHDRRRDAARTVRRRAESGRSGAERARSRAALRDVGRAPDAAGGAAGRGGRGRRGAPAMSDALCDLDLRGLSDAIARGEVTSVQATEAYLDRIERHDRVLRAYITVMADDALGRAKAADAEPAQGRRRGSLHGVPIAVKDLVAIAGVRMTAGSRVLADHVPARDAFVTERLHAAGAVILGKLSMHEFAFGRPVVDDPFVTGRNPWDIHREPAGSSSGSAVAVAAGLCAGALGSDTGGSIRGPAARCGIVGLKPTYGLVSRRGVVPLSWSLDHVGPMTRTVSDTAVLLQAIAGYECLDAWSTDADAGVHEPTRGRRARDTARRAAPLLRGLARARRRGAHRLAGRHGRARTAGRHPRGRGRAHARPRPRGLGDVPGRDVRVSPRHL